ncbi:MAG: triacylglycerol lipase [Myxococcaceae bacterium]
MGKQRFYLLPGFFGFANLGEFVYFGHVRNMLVDELHRRGIDAEVHVVLSHPTASIRARARDLLATLTRTALHDDGPIHLIGHSTGGLDARLFVTPGADLGDVQNLPAPETFVGRVKSIVCVATPNRGTGLSPFFTGLMGAKLLELLSLFTVYVLRFGRIPLKYAFRLASVFIRMDRRLGWKDTVVDQLFADLLADFSPERRTAVSAFFKQVTLDQSLVAQLAPEGMDLFNAGVGDRPGIRYGSVITQARPPSLRTRLASGFDPYAQVTQSLYAFLYKRVPIRPPNLSEAHRTALRTGYGLYPRDTACDGIVPTASQPWGNVIATVWADHLDVIGHFDGPGFTPPHIDWILSATGFRRDQFIEVWRKITDYCLA